KIDRVGRGPGEYLQIDDFDIHDGKVYLLAWGKVQRCSLSGEYESTVLSDREATMIHITDAGHIMLVGSDLSDECLVHEYDFDGNLIHGYLEVDKAFKEVLFRTDSGWGFSKCDGRLYFSVPMLETIYELNDGKATPVFNFLTERSPAKFLAQDVPGNPDGMNYDMRLNKFWGKLDDNYCCPYKKMVSTRYYTCYGRNKHSRVVFLYDRHSKTGIGGESVASYLMDMMFYDSSSQISDDTFAVDMSNFTGDELISMRAFAKLQGEQINIDVFNRLCQLGKSENSNPCLLIYTLK
ncbi:MAG: 6-bladed beta-propeller, partial [Bacteroidales bacterium]|nr:6-bladed beta-propeller [Bacteroidales bacterium]